MAALRFGGGAAGGRRHGERVAARRAGVGLWGERARVCGGPAGLAKCGCRLFAVRHDPGHTAKAMFAVCPDPRHTANSAFAVCPGPSTRQTFFCNFFD